MMLDPIVKTIEVPCGQKKAFTVFVNDMPRWWPLDKRSMSLKSLGKPAKALRIDARREGKIVEIAHDDTELLWGTITAYDPYDLFRMNFHMGMPPQNASVVEVRFTPIDHQRTRVELTQSNWEAMGDMAEMMRGFYGSSWDLLFGEAYKSACGA
jgi:hypothetical protein